MILNIFQGMGSAHEDSAQEGQTKVRTNSINPLLFHKYSCHTILTAVY